MALMPTPQPGDAQRAVPAPLRIAYLVNRYPAAPHTFIRREIVELEKLGLSVERFSIRDSSHDLVDPADRAELARTRVVLTAGLATLLLAGLWALLTRPRRFLATLAATAHLAGPSDRGLVPHAAYLLEACLLARWLDGRVQHLHAHFGSNPASVALLFHLLTGITYSFTVHGTETFDNPEAQSLDDKVRRAAFVVSASDFGRGLLYRWSELEFWPRIQVVRCGVDEAFLRAAPTPPPAAPRLACVARLSKEKAHLLLVEAAARLAAEGLEFEIALVGDGPLRAEIEAQIERRGLQGRVRVLGWSTGQQVRDELLAARALVLPSLAEGLPVVIMEALALGRPVISTYVAGIPELVEPGVSGWLVPAGSVDGLAEAMRDALTAAPERLEEMGRAGATRVAERHDAGREALRLARLFEAAVAPRATGERS